MKETINYDRRRFLGSAALSVAAANLGIIGSVGAQIGKLTPVGPTPINGKSSSIFDTIKQIDAGVLNVGYAEAGAPDGKPVILLHGWPYDIHTYVDVAPLLAAKGYRVVVPFLRGYGTTRFLKADTLRMNKPSISCFPNAFSNSSRVPMSPDSKKIRSSSLISVAVIGLFRFSF